MKFPHGPTLSGQRCEHSQCAKRSMHQCSVEKVAPRFKEVAHQFHHQCTKNPRSVPCRKMIMRLRDSLNIFGFSYFPVHGLKLKWHSQTRCVPYDAKIHVHDKTSDDPIYVLMQYTQGLYQAMGDATDADMHGRKSHVAKRCDAVRDNLMKWLVELVGHKHIPGTSIAWEDYMDKAGAQHYSVKANSTLYLQYREGKAQFWGHIKPDPSLNCVQNGCLLVTNEINKALHRYRLLQQTAPKGSWWHAIAEHPSAKADQFPHFEMFHVIRKSVRTVLNTHKAVGPIGAALYFPLSVPAMAWLHKHSHQKVKPGVTYAEALCIEDAKCTPVPDLVALLIVGDVQQFPIGSFWRLNEVDYRYLRGLAVIGAGLVGSEHDKYLGSKIRPKHTGCPNVADVKKYKHNKGGLSRSTAWWTGSEFKGTICGMVAWQGAIHDKMMQAHAEPKIAPYVKAESAIIGEHWEHINLPDVLAGVLEGTCHADDAQLLANTRE
jgi:hypothetical protein